MYAGAPKNLEAATPAAMINRPAARNPSMDKTYNPAQIEQRSYARWEANGWFSPRGAGAPYCIVIPPPNVTGILAKA